MTRSASDIDWLILGGGVAGLTLAATIAQSSTSFLLLEQNDNHSEAGAGLFLAPNATRILQNLGLWKAMLAHGQVTRQWLIRDQSGTILRQIRMPADVPPALCISWGDLTNEIRKSLPASCVQKGKATSITGTEEQANITLSDGEECSAKALIGADGIRSPTREYLFGHMPLRYRGYVSWRGIVPFVPDTHPPGTITESWGNGGCFGIAPVDSTQTYWYASANQEEIWVDDPASRKDGLLKRFRGWHSPIPALIDGTPNEQILVSRIYDGPKLRHWSKQRITLCGDAAHAMTPNLGQGACLAMEDAWTLGKMTERYSEPETLFAAYERSRISRVSSIQQQSRALGFIVQADNPYAVTLRNWIAPKVPEHVLQWGLRAIFAEQTF